MLIPPPSRPHRSRRRLKLPAASPPPAPAVVIVVVFRLGPYRFAWEFNQSFDDSHADEWVAADFAGLTIDGTAPIEIDEVAGNDGTLVLDYPFSSAIAYHVAQTPAVLIFANGATSIVPANGPVLP